VEIAGEEPVRKTRRRPDRFFIFAHGGGLYTNIDDNDVFETSAKSMFSGATSMYFRLQGT